MKGTGLTKNFLSKMTEVLLHEAYEYSNTELKIPSKSIRTYMYIEYTKGEKRGYVVVPQYWATYYHNGRGNVYASPSGVLVYYKNPEEDPRIANGYPFTSAQVKHLSPQRFREDAAAGKLIITKKVGPAITKHPFFDDNSSLGMLGFKQKAESIVTKETDKFMKGFLQETGLQNRKITVEI